ncbi:dimethylarginine dimethylaminohydrolase family protein [Trueperella pecoris]|uniref:N(G),N(G)-dimethylarginine dimethylaminohydrolase n=1 Tax=Trueperella pecoris TaxID=2733571 RepID=A0A7M1QXH1_9ACTO|nr:arginine deiminase family protein [Trueperella pecoris]QOR46546.1 N(G),N(G)-dimethylarginine dimethylaminohydrolase [Trueperella pecoris]
MELTYALVREPSPKMDQGQLTHLDQQDMSPQLARVQWHSYCDILRDFTEVVEVEPTPELPDSIFVEDTVFTYGNLAVKTKMHPTRIQEQESLVRVLVERGFDVVDLPQGAHLEGGDCLKFGGKVWVGLSTRSNKAGVDALQRHLDPMGVEVVGVPVERALHLKSCLTALPDGTFISHRDYAPPAQHFPGLRYVEEFLGTQVVIVDEKTLLMSASAPKTTRYLRAEGFEVLTTPMTEIEKMEGSVTCLSVRVRR